MKKESEIKYVVRVRLVLLLRPTFDSAPVLVLPKGKNAIGLRWVFIWKEIEDSKIPKARIVALGHHQRPDDYGNTYAPVAKITSIHIVLAFAAHEDLELYTFDVCTAFLNTPLHEKVYVKQILGYPLKNPKSAQCLLKAIYGLKQSPHEWFREFSSVLIALGLSSCPVDEAVFMGRWSKSNPHPTLSMPTDGSDIYIIIPIHIDDGLAATNSKDLYVWLIDTLNHCFSIKNLGAALMFLGIRIEQDRPTCKLWLSQKHFVMDLLATHNMLQCTKSSILSLKNSCPCQTTHCQMSLMRISSYYFKVSLALISTSLSWLDQILSSLPWCLVNSMHVRIVLCSPLWRVSCDTLMLPLTGLLSMGVHTCKRGLGWMLSFILILLWWMRIGHRMSMTTRVFLVLGFSSMVAWFLGPAWSRNQSPCPQQSWSIWHWLMYWRNCCGYRCSFVCRSFLFLVRSLLDLTIRLLLKWLPHIAQWVGWNILIFVIISFKSTCVPTSSSLIGCLPLTWLLMFWQNLSLHCFMPNIPSS